MVTDRSVISMVFGDNNIDRVKSCDKNEELGGDQTHTRLRSHARFGLKSCSNFQLAQKLSSEA